MDEAPHAPDEQAAQQRFREDLLRRGEAARADGSELPPGATHEIVEEDDGEASIVRRRFSAS